MRKKPLKGLLMTLKRQVYLPCDDGPFWIVCRWNYNMKLGWWMGTSGKATPDWAHMWYNPCQKEKGHDYKGMKMPHKAAVHPNPCFNATVPVSSGVVQRAARPHGLKVIDAPSHEWKSGPEDGEDPD